MRKFIQQNTLFYTLYLSFFIVGSILLLFVEKGDEIIYFNSLHTPFFDSFFKYITRLAEAPLLLFSLLIALRFSYGKGLILALNLLLIFAIVGLLKHFAFSSEVRPSVFFEGKQHLHFVPGLEILKYHSFPSGHSAGAFGFFCMLSLLVKEKRWSILFFILALLAGISRVYLLQHFFRDVYAGSFIAVFCSTIFYLTFVRSGFYNRLHWKDKAFFK